MKRFSIATLMLVVLICGVAVAALKQASDAWAGALLLLTLLLLGSAVLGVRYRKEARQAFWFGFAAFGWGYLVLAMGPWLAEQVGSKLPTTQLLSYAHERLHPPATRTVIFDDLVVFTGNAPKGPPVVQVQPGAATTAFSQTFGFTSFNGNGEQFQRIGHCLFALLAAVIGGLMARRFQRTNREAPV